MGRCLYNGLHYPFYIVSEWIWKKDEKKEAGGEYDLVVILETESWEEALAKVNEVEISADIPEVLIELDDGENIEWCGTRDESGFYDT